MTILQVRAPAEQKSQPLTHESSSVGAHPSSAAPVEQNPQMGLSLPLNGVRKRVGPIRRGRPRTDALRQKSFRVLGIETSVRRSGQRTWILQQPKITSLPCAEPIDRR